MTTVEQFKPRSTIIGYDGTGREKPYKDINEVLNFIGVMAKRDKVPLARMPTRNPRAMYFYDKLGYTYYVPVNWRNYLYEDLKSRYHYIISPSSFNNETVFSWDIFRLSDLMDGHQCVRKNKYGKIGLETIHHSGSFIDLIRKCDINEVLDTLAKNRKPITIKVREAIRTPDHKLIYVFCNFDI